DLQLLHDINIHWSSTLLMIEHAILLCAAIDRFLDSCDFPELKKYKLNDVEWQALNVFKDILSACRSFKPCDVPHAFQQKLSSEKTPTLCDSIPSFEAMSRVWQQQADKYPDRAAVIQPGLDKLEAYHAHISCVPAYVLTMGESLKIFRCKV
ncbi:hypothetical protein BDR06DRAFT_886918, partial [Suillus hirtellus]